MYNYEYQQERGDMAKKSEPKTSADKPAADEGKLKALGLAMEQITKQFGIGRRFLPSS